MIAREDLGTTPFDRAEGLRYLSRLLAAGLSSFVEATGPAHPVFRPLPEMVKMGLDNPDNYYVSASIDPRRDYRIRGQRGTIHYLSFAAQNQNFAARDRITGGAGHLNDSELALDADGSFEIVASQREQEGNWLRLGPDTKQILARQTFLERARERPVELAIECVGVAGAPPALDPARVGGQLLGSAMYAIGCAQWFADWVIGFRAKAPVNSFHLPTRTITAGSAAIRTSACGSAPGGSRPTRRCSSRRRRRTATTGTSSSATSGRSRSTRASSAYTSTAARRRIATTARSSSWSRTATRATRTGSPPRDTSTARWVCAGCSPILIPSRARAW